MNYHFIKLFSLKEGSKSNITHFNNFLKFKEINNVTYLIEHGPYQSTEGRNKSYNYILKIAIDGDTAKFKSEIENDYLELLELLKPSLNEEEDIFSIEYEPSTQHTNQSVYSQSPINHVVFLPFKQTCKNKEINKSFELLTNLFNELPGISSFSYGKCRDSISNKNYIFEMNFSDAEKRDSYLTDKQHIEVAHRIIPLLKNGSESIIAFDYLTSMTSKKLSSLPNSSFFKLKPETNVVEKNPALKPALN
jgi:Stress responsive A/B Barrel Domain